MARIDVFSLSDFLVDQSLFLLNVVKLYLQPNTEPQSCPHIHQLLSAQYVNTVNQARLITSLNGPSGKCQMGLGASPMPNVGTIQLRFLDTCMHR